MNVTQQHPMFAMRPIFGGVMACSILLLPFTAFALVRAYYVAPASPPAVEAVEAEIEEKYDAKYHETRCYQVVTLRNYHEAQEQWEAPCACTANFAVIAEV